MGWFIWLSGFETPAGRHFTLVDDAMISMTYARTLAETGEWVWFPGADRVQGITNPLWTLFMAMIHLTGIEGSSGALTVSITGVVIVVLCAALAARLAGDLVPDRHRRTVMTTTLAVVPFLYPLTFWTLRGMEVGLLALCALGCSWAVHGLVSAWDRGTPTGSWLILFSATSVIGVLTRLDYALPVGVLGLMLLSWAPCHRQRLGVLALAAAPVGAALVGVLLFQYSYWGDVLPNTYRLKMEGFPVEDRLLRGVAATGKLLPLLALTYGATAVAVRAIPERARRRTVVALASLVGTTVLYSIWVGGDAWEVYFFANRYASTSLPATATLIVAGSAHLFEADPHTQRRASFGLAVTPVLALGTGVLVNPYGFGLLPAALSALLLAAVLLLAVRALLDVRRNPTDVTPRLVTAGAVAAALVVSTSGLPLAVMAVGAVPVATDEDRRYTEVGAELQRVTKGDAVVGVGPAGAIGYYSHRPMHDGHGKSDRILAAMPPAWAPPGHPYSTFLPGHNKWDLQHSLGVVRPDIAWGLPFTATDKDPKPWVRFGYDVRCIAVGSLPVLVRSDSTLIRSERLVACDDPESTPSR